MSKKTSVSGTASDPILQFAKLKIDGVDYSLAYSFNSIALAESVSNCNLLKGLESLTDLSATQLRGLLFAALSIAHPDITIEQAGHLVRLDTIAQVTLALAQAYNLSMPDSKKNEGASEVKPPTIEKSGNAAGL